MANTWPPWPIHLISAHRHHWASTHTHTHTVSVCILSHWKKERKKCNKNRSTADRKETLSPLYLSIWRWSRSRSAQQTVWLTSTHPLLMPAVCCLPPISLGWSLANSQPSPFFLLLLLPFFLPTTCACTHIHSVVHSFIHPFSSLLSASATAAAKLATRAWWLEKEKERERESEWKGDLLGYKYKLHFYGKWGVSEWVVDQMNKMSINLVRHYCQDTSLCVCMSTVHCFTAYRKDPFCSCLSHTHGRTARLGRTTGIHKQT